MTQQATIPTPAGGVPVAPQPPEPGATAAPAPDPATGSILLPGTLVSDVSATEAILAKLATSGFRKSSFVALIVALVWTFLGGFLAAHGLTQATLTTYGGYAFDGVTVVYIVVSKWHDIQAGKIASVVKQAAQSVQAEQGG